MGYFRFVSALGVSTFIASGAWAGCLTCDEVIELNRAGIICFKQSLDQGLPAPNELPRVYDLSECLATSAAGDRGGLATMPNFTDRIVEAHRMKSRYLLDYEYARCLNTILDGVIPENVRQVNLDLYAQCQ